ncbi:MAG: epoxyqueuosine reductase [Syntrophotaleaceae bacterium]
MDQVIREEIRSFVRASPDNRFAGSNRPYFDEPLVGYAAAEDPLFSEFKKIIGDFHLTPGEVLHNASGCREEEAKTVICWVLPISEATRRSNRQEKKMPSREWAMTRSHGERFNNLLRIYVTNLIHSIGAIVASPLLTGLWRPVKDPRIGMASTWSERHAAYAAGLGTFSLNDGFITDRGIAHRCGSVVTDLEITASPRTCADPWSNCLYHRNGSCGLCVHRCPAGAISLEGHDKEKCQAYVYGELRQTAGPLYGVMETGCGLCQTGVPCEARVPTTHTNQGI